MYEYVTEIINCIVLTIDRIKKFSLKFKNSCRSCKILLYYSGNSVKLFG